MGYEEAVLGKPPGKYIGAGELPPVNADIIDTKCNMPLEFDAPYDYLNQPIRPGLKEHTDYEIISREQWEIFTHNFQHYVLKRYLAEGLDGKKVEVYFFRVRAILLYNQALRDIENERLKKYLTVEVQFPHYKPLTEEFM